MKKIKLLLAATAAMVGLGANAQSWTASEVGEGYYMLYNVGTNQFLTRGNGWGTQASITTEATAGNGIALRLAGSGTDFKMFTGIGGTDYGVENLSGGYIYTDQSRNKNATWTFTQVGTDNGPVYTIVSSGENHGGGAGAYLTAGVDGTIVTPGTDGTIDGAKWKLMSIPAQPIGMDDASEVNPVDATSLIVNQNFSFPAILQSGTGSWTVNASNKNLCGGDVTNPCAESWRSAFTISQTLTVPSGIYELTAQAALSDYAHLYDGANYPVVFANSETATFNEMEEADRETSMNQLSNSFKAGKYNVGPIRVVVTNGSLTIGVRGTRTDTWCIWDNFRLTYKGIDLTELKAALQAQIDAVPALEGTTTTAAYNAAKNYADGIDVAALTTEEAISTASSELAALVAAAEALQNSYTRYLSVKAAVVVISQDVNTSDADAAAEAATTNEAIDAAVVTLRAVLLTYLPTIQLGEGEFIDVTTAMVDNASVRQNTDYWTIEGTPNGGYSWGKCSNNECEFYQQNFKFYQTLALTPGTWEFGVTGFHRAGNHNTYFYAGEDDKILIPGVENTVVNTMAQAETYFNNGNGKVALKFLIETAQNVEIGINNQDTQTDKWTIFRDFTLKYYGAPDYTVYDNEWADLVVEANAIKNDAKYANVTGSELTDLNDAIADSPVGSNLKATYIEKKNALQAAIQAFKAAAPAYDKYVAYKAETVALFGSDLNVAAPSSAATADDAIHALNVAQYNKVESDYPYSLTSKIGDFSTWDGTAEVGTPREAGTPNSLDWEHWSGTTHPYYEQDGTGYYDEGGWTIQYTKTTTLTAGSYAVKVAARSSSGVSSNITITAAGSEIAPVISLPCVGNRARGIAKDGTASWSDDKEYILENQGGGWEWRFVPFTLDAETTVTMTFYAEASTGAQWMSIGDGELLSTENIATAVAYNETATNTIEDVDVANVTITRTIKEGYNTVCLPFDLTLGQMEAAFGTGAQVYAFKENNPENTEDITIEFNKVDAGTISANVPVLVKATKASQELVFEGVQVVAPTADVKVAGNNASFVGVYAPTTIGKGHFFIGNGALYKSAGSTNIKAFRAYIQLVNPNTSNEVKLFIDDEEISTGIDSLLGETEGASIIYNVAGQRISKMQKGINIVNGKKIAVK